MYARDGKVCTPTEGPTRAKRVHTRQIDAPSRRTDERTDPGSRIDGQGPAADNATPESVGRPEGPTNEQRRRESTPTRDNATRDNERSGDRGQEDNDRGADAIADAPQPGCPCRLASRPRRPPAGRPAAGRARGSSARVGAELGSRSSAPARAEQAGRRTAPPRAAARRRGSAWNRPDGTRPGAGPAPQRSAEAAAGRGRASGNRRLDWRRSRYGSRSRS